MSEQQTEKIGAGQEEPYRFLNRAQLAQALGKSEPTIDRWIKLGMPVHRVGSNGRPYEFSLDDVLAWRRNFDAEMEEERRQLAETIRATQQSLDLEGGSANGVDALPFKLRKEYYEAEQVRMRVSRARGELCEVVSVRLMIERALKHLGDRLQSMPDALERACALPPETVDRITREIDEMQSDLARELSTFRLSADLDASRAA